MTGNQKNGLIRLARREINTFYIGKAEFQNNHGHLLCFYNGYLALEYENGYVTNKLTGEKFVAAYGKGTGLRNYRRVRNLFVNLVHYNQESNQNNIIG